MSTTYKIYPIRVGSEWWPRYYMRGNGAGHELEENPMLMFYLEGGDHKILVDTGGGIPGSDHMLKYHNGGRYSRPDDEEPTVALKRATGVSAEDIDVLIITHLHWDHACNVHLFPNAKVYVQISEVYAAINPCPRYAKTYEAFNIGTVPQWAKHPANWQFIDGDQELFPGIKVVTMPGHSKGLQGVLVDTTDGLYLLGSDQFPLYDNFKDGKFNPTSLALSLEEGWQTCEKMDKMGVKFLIPGHEMKLLEHKYYPVD